MKLEKIGIHGAVGAGKDTVAKFLCEHEGFIRNGFADPLKRAAQQMFLLTEAQTWDDELKDVVIPFWGMSPREMFQKLGTESGRKVFGDDLWLKRWRLHFSEYQSVVNYVTPDVRFENEATLLRDLGFTIVHLRGPNRRRVKLSSENAKHASEAGLLFCPHLGDVMIFNEGTHEDLFEQVSRLLSNLRGS